MPARGHVRAPNKDFLIAQKAAQHGDMLTRKAMAPTPPSLDSRALGYCGPIKDQSQCGSCWDFSGTGVCEVAFNVAGVLTPATMILSEEYTLDCGRNGGCNGDDNVTVLDWAKSTGLPLTADYGPYTARAGQCKYKTGMTLYKINDWGFADGSGGSGVTPTDKIKTAIMSFGCVGCACDAGFSDPGDGVISGGGSNIDHDVILVGWDDSKGKGGAWIMRNSWGTGWGSGGYAWIEYGSYSIGTEAVWASVIPVLPPPWPPYL